MSRLALKIEAKILVLKFLLFYAYSNLVFSQLSHPACFQELSWQGKWKEVLEAFVAFW